MLFTTNSIATAVVSLFDGWKRAGEEFRVVLRARTTGLPTPIPVRRLHGLAGGYVNPGRDSVVSGLLLSAAGAWRRLAVLACLSVARCVANLQALQKLVQTLGLRLLQSGVSTSTGAVIWCEIDSILISRAVELSATLYNQLLKCGKGWLGHGQSSYYCGLAG